MPVRAQGGGGTIPRMDARTVCVVIAVGAATPSLSLAAQSQSPGQPDDTPGGGEIRPAPSVLHLSEPDVLAGFTPEVRSTRALRDRALALWRTHFEAQAAAVRQRFAQDADWRPALADAAALVDDFLEASLLPRAGAWSAGAGQVWVEKLDPATGQRTRSLQPAPARPLLLAPQDFGQEAAEPEGLEGRPPTVP